MCLTWRLYPCTELRLLKSVMHPRDVFSVYGNSNWGNVPSPWWNVTWHIRQEYHPKIANKHVVFKKKKTFSKPETHGEEQSNTAEYTKLVIRLSWSFRREYKEKMYNSIIPRKTEPMFSEKIIDLCISVMKQYNARDWELKNTAIKHFLKDIHFFK